MSRLASTRRTVSKLPSADSSKSVANSKPPSTLDQLTSELAGLRIADKKGKQRQASDSEISPEARKVQAMKGVNASSQSLSKFAQSGWKRSKPSRGTSLSDVKKCITEATKALTYLRGLDEGNLDIEKSASSVVGKLISMEMFDESLSMLSDMHSRLNTLVDPRIMKISPEPGQSHLLSISLPESTHLPGSSTLTLLSTYFLHVVTALLHHSSNIQALMSHFAGPSSLLAWAPQLHGAVDAKHLDTIMTRTYTTLVKSQPANLSPGVTFTLRCHGLACLIYTSPQTISPDTFWDQAVKYAGSLLKSAGQDEDAVSLISGSFEDLMSRVDVWKQGASFTKSSQFIAFCECWTAVAKRAGKVEVMARVGEIISRASAHSDPSIPSTHGAQASVLSPSNHRIATAALCALLSQTEVTLQQGNGISPGAVVLVEKLILELSNASYIWSSAVPSAELEAVGKAHRALERVRRTSIKLFEDAKLDVALRDALKRLQSSIVDLMANTLSHDVTLDSYTQILDSLFILARTTLDIRNAHTHGDAYDYLQRAATILNITGPPSSSTTIDRPNLLRCISGAFHNLAGTLYNAERYGAAIRFLTRACELGTRALAWRREQVPQSGEKKEVDQSWRQLEEQLYRRWELLGVCHCKIGDHLAGYRAFLEAIRSFPFSATNLGPLSDKQSIATIFGTSGSLRQLAVLVDRATYMGTCELFIQPPQVSLLHAFDDDEHQDPRVKGALLEHQLASISPNRSKEGVLAVMRQLLRDLLDLYDAASMPIRRTRTLVQCLEVAYYDVSTATLEQCAFASYVEVVESVQEMLGRQDVGNDQALVHCKGVLQASAHAWAAIHAHRGAAPSQISQATFHANEACSALASIITTASRKSFGSARKSSSAAIRRVSSPKVFKKLPSPKAPRKAPPKRTVPRKPLKVLPKMGRTASSLQPNGVPQTPKARNTEEAPIALAAATTSPPKQRASEELLGLIDVLQAMSCMLGFIGLTLTKIRTLIALRRLTDSQSGYDALSDVYVSASTELAVEYVNLGKMKKAATIHRQVLNVIQTGSVSAVSRAKFFLRYAQALALCENTSSSTEAYAQAMESSNEFPMEEKGMSSSQRIHMRVTQLEAAAMATRTFAVIQYSKADVPLALDSLLQSVRLYNRALESMARLSPSPGPSTSGDANPFEDTSQRTSSPHEQAMERVNRHEVPPATPSRRSVMKGSEWGVADGLFNTFFALVDAYSSRGSPREALFFAEQAHDLADSLNAPLYASRALARMGEILIYQGRYQKGFDNVSEAGKLLADMQCADVVDIDRLHAEWYRRTSPGQNAKELYERAKSALEGLDRAYGAYDSGPRRSSLSMVAKERIAPVLFARLLSQYIWILRDDDAVEKEALLDTFLSLPPSPSVKAEQAALVAKLTMHNVYERFGMDMFLSSITESTIAIPMSMSRPEGVTPSITHDIPGLLEKASQMYWSELDLISTQGEVPKVRNAAVSLAMIQALQTSLGKNGAAASNILVNLLDATTAISLHREMLDVVRHKFDQLRSTNDLQWPSTERPTGAKVAVPRFSLDDADGDSEDEAVEDQATKEYWEALRSHHQDQSLDLTTLSTSRSTELPPNWTIVHICITENRSTLFITRQNCGPDQPKPLVFCVPMQGRRENDGDEDEEHLSFDDALNELSQIITLSDKGTRDAAHINRDDIVGREQWWKERKELDTRLKELLSNIEFCWLGAFKTILNQNPRLGSDDLKALGMQFERIFQTGLHLQDKTKPRSKGKKQKASAKPAHHFTIDDALLECFSTLSPKCRDEELEDLVYFILDLYQFHGVPVATAEVDVTQVVVDLRGVFEDHAQRMAQQKKSAPRQKPKLGDDEHMFLILDKNLQGIPWESIPVLRGRSVSRIPSMQFLLDRVRFANMRRPGHSKKFVDPRQTYYVLNPSGDLTKTEDRFKDWLDEMKRDAGWDGVVGHRPSEQQFLDALSRNELLIYFGHGGGEQYARSHKIRHLKKCAATMLWGCSSGALKDMGDFDRVGTPYNYMLAGCPTLVANLWDVTDRDIDKFSQAVFDKLRLNSQDVKSWKSDDDEGCSLVTAVAEAREVCKLKYLTGAAAVVYGVPFYL
ncbi:separin protein [Pleurotus ostreatus]|nr:separin protein [Pleurotus ostreatus]